MQLTPTLRNSTLILALGLGAAEVQADEARPVFSEPYSVSDARAAFAEIDMRWDMAEAEQQARFMAFNGKIEDFVRSDPILQQVSWDYDTCINLISLIPPPLKGWGLRSEASFVEIPVSDTGAQVEYVRYGAGLGSADEGFYPSEESVSVVLSNSSDMVQFFDTMMAQEMLRDASFDQGPFNYPLLKHSNKTLLGDITVDVTATRPEDAQLYLQEIIGCAIKNGMIAAGVDPDALRSQP